MTMSQLSDIIQLLHDEWRPYNNQPENFVYENLNCKEYRKKRPGWFYKGEKFLCLGCSNRCMLFRPSGFQAPIPIHYSFKLDKYTYSAQELVDKKATLTVEEVCYCLNISRSQVYKMIRFGELTALRQKPVRVKSEEVKKLMQNFDE